MRWNSIPISFFRKVETASPALITCSLKDRAWLHYLLLLQPIGSAHHLGGEILPISTLARIEPKVEIVELLRSSGRLCFLFISLARDAGKISESRYLHKCCCGGKLSAKTNVACLPPRSSNIYSVGIRDGPKPGIIARKNFRKQVRNPDTQLGDNAKT